jgi:hypothetical protein
MYNTVRTVLYTSVVTAAADAPAAGSPLAQVAIATVFATAVTVALLALVSSHRSGRSTLLARAGAHAGRVLGLQPWAALPFVVGGVGLVAGAFGVFWDISLHIDVGRDEGPLANPAHYLILFALYSCFAAGVVAIALHEGAARQAPRALRLPGGASAPVGGVLLAVSGGFALAGFPLDDLWHRMFGQDVTLWGPTHLIMINGAILSVPCLGVLMLESRLASGRALSAPPRSLLERLLRATLPAALLFAVAFWATEFDWGIPQYRLVWQPLLLAFAAGLALVCARLWLGRGGALAVVGLYLVSRGAIELGVHLLGQTAPSMPLFVVEALVLEALAWRAGPIRAPLRFGLIAGLLVGAVGFAAEYAWTQIAMPYPWSPALLAEGLPTALLAGLAGGTLGALLGAGVRGELPTRRVRRIAGWGAAAAMVALGANALWLDEPAGVRAQVALTPAAVDRAARDGAAASDSAPGAARDGGARSAGASAREAFVTARIDPPAAARDAEWLTVMAWQGGGIVVRPLHRVGPDRWRTDAPVALHGDWKTSLRLQNGRALLAIPLHLPRDPAIPTPGVTRPAQFGATFGPDVKVMQTERRDYVPGWLWTPAALLMLLLCGLFVTAIAVGVARVVDPAAPPARRGSAAASAALRA